LAFALHLLQTTIGFTECASTSSNFPSLFSLHMRTLGFNDFPLFSWSPIDPSFFVVSGGI
jgi:hypothetical protein